MSDYGFEQLGGLTPPFKTWAEPETAVLYSVGVDTAEGLGHGDQSCVMVLRHDTGEQVACFCDRLPPDLCAVVADRLGRWYNGALLVVEANNHGIATINTLRHLGYKSLYRRRQINRLYNRTTEEYGFKTTRTSKPLIISALDEALRNQEVMVHEAETFVELKGYVRDDAGRMGGSPFDDRVMALALAHHGRGFMHLREPEDEAKDDYMTFGWWQRLASEPDSPRLVVGAHARRSGSGALR